MYNNKAIRRVVRAGRRSTIGNRVTGYNLFEGSNPLLSAKNEKAVPQGMAFSFLFARDSNKEGAGLPAEENNPADCFRRRGQGASRREGIRQYAEKIPC